MKRDNVKTICATGLVVVGFLGLAIDAPFAGWFALLGAVVLLDC
jgi:preprotein translocase subunit Sss1